MIFWQSNLIVYKDLAFDLNIEWIIEIVLKDDYMWRLHNIENLIWFVSHCKNKTQHVYNKLLYSNNKTPFLSKNK